MSRTDKTYMLVGGGSGGHLTPLIAVADALKRQSPAARIVYVGQKGESLQAVVEHPAIDDHAAISAGKFRRYHGESLLRHMLDVKTVALNVRDFFKFLVGLGQAWRLLGRLRPDVIFLKGGFVCVPVGFAARLRGIPYITHDSDAIPGLANRLTAGHARYNTTAMSPQLYPYDASKTVQVGIPLQPEFTKVSATELKQAKLSLGYKETDQVLFCVGGGLGARSINESLAHASAQLLNDYDNLYIIQITGKKLFDETKQLYSKVLPESLVARVKLIDFTTELYKFSAAADVVLTRAGATNIAEFAAQAKACVVVPAPHLTGGQQLHNAAALRKAEAAIIVDEDKLDSLAATIGTLLKDSNRRTGLGERLHELARSDAAEKLAQLLVETAGS